MDRIMRVIILLCCGQLAAFTDPPADCVIELRCMECVPDNMPLVTSHRAANGSVVATSGDELTFACPGGKFLAYHLWETLTVVCEGGRYRVNRDRQLRHLLELGCQEDSFEDVMHQVEHCGGNLQGRSYQVRESQTRGVHHLATLCYDTERAACVRAHVTANTRLPPHSDARSPLTLLGNFNQMFDTATRHDAQKLYSDDIRLNRRIRELFRHEGYSFAAQKLTAGEILSPLYFNDQNARVADFASNKIGVWESVATGNLKHVHHDVAKFTEQNKADATLDIYAGTHEVLSLRTGNTRTHLYLKPDRFPVPKYLWTVVHDKRSQKALAIVTLNDPFIAVSEIRDTLFCESACSRVQWLHELKRHRNFEAPIYGLVFCCDVHNFMAVVNEMPRDILKDVPQGNLGMLTDLIL